LKTKNRGESSWNPEKNQHGLLSSCRIEVRERESILVETGFRRSVLLEQNPKGSEGLNYGYLEKRHFR
jgi:hypothetical protein